MPSETPVGRARHGIFRRPCFILNSMRVSSGGWRLQRTTRFDFQSGGCSGCSGAVRWPCRSSLRPVRSSPDFRTGNPGRSRRAWRWARSLEIPGMRTRESWVSRRRGHPSPLGFIAVLPARFLPFRFFQGVWGRAFSEEARSRSETPLASATTSCPGLIFSSPRESFESSTARKGPCGARASLTALFRVIRSLARRPSWSRRTSRRAVSWWRFARGRVRGPC